MPENNKVFDYNNFLTGCTGSELYSSLKWDNMEQPLSGEYSFNLVNAADNTTYTNDDAKIDSGTGVITIKNHKNITSPQLKVKVTDNVLDLSYTSTEAFSVNFKVKLLWEYGYQTKTLANSIVKCNDDEISTTEEKSHMRFVLPINGEEVNNPSDYNLVFGQTTGILKISAKTDYDINNVKIGIHDDVYDITKYSTNGFSIKIVHKDGVAYHNNFSDITSDLYWKSGCTTTNLSKWMYFIKNSNEEKMSSEYVSEYITFRIYNGINGSGITDIINNISDVTFDTSTGVLKIEAKTNIEYSKIYIKAFDNQYHYEYGDINNVFSIHMLERKQLLLEDVQY